MTHENLIRLSAEVDREATRLMAIGAVVKALEKLSATLSDMGYSLQIDTYGSGAHAAITMHFDAAQLEAGRTLALVDRGRADADQPVPATCDTIPPVDTTVTAQAVLDDPLPDAAPVAPPITVEQPNSDLLPASHPLSDEERKLLLALYDQGQQNGDIARALGRAAQGFYHTVKRVVLERDAAPTAPQVPAAAPVEATIPQVKTAEVARPAASATAKPDAPQETLKTADAHMRADGIDPSQMPVPERQLHARLDRLGNRDPWTPANDAFLVCELAKGRKLAEVSLDLAVDTAQAKARWNLLTGGDISIDTQTLLIKVLRARAQHVQAA